MMDELLDAIGPGERLLLIVFFGSALLIVGLAVNLIVWQIGLILMIAGGVALVAGPVWVWRGWRQSDDGSSNEDRE